MTWLSSLDAEIEAIDITSAMIAMIKLSETRGRLRFFGCAVGVSNTSGNGWSVMAGKGSRQLSHSWDILSPRTALAKSIWLKLALI